MYIALTSTFTRCKTNFFKSFILAVRFNIVKKYIDIKKCSQKFTYDEWIKVDSKHIYLMKFLNKPLFIH